MQLLLIVVHSYKPDDAINIHGLKAKFQIFTGSNMSVSRSLNIFYDTPVEFSRAVCLVLESNCVKYQDPIY